MNFEPFVVKIEPKLELKAMTIQYDINSLKRTQKREFCLIESLDSFEEGMTYLLGRTMYARRPQQNHSNGEAEQR